MSELLSSSLSIKFLVSGSFAGSLIGTGGGAVKELMEVSGCKVAVSGSTDFFPGTNDRVVIFSGTLESLNIATSLFWELVNLQNQNPGKTRSIVWSPKAYKDLLSSDNDRILNGKITIPAEAGGLILGRGGTNFKFMSEQSGAKVQMTSKEEALFTQERVMSVSGSVSQCRNFTIMVLSKLVEEEDSAVYANKGTKYSALAMGHSSPRGRGGDRDGSATGGGYGSSPRRSPGAILKQNDVLVPAATQITMTVPESLIGNIIGKQGSTLREMASLSGAKIEVSVRPQFANGTDDRIVTISGAPGAAQTAHLYCIEKLKQGKSAPRVRGTRGGPSAGGEIDN